MTRIQTKWKFVKASHGLKIYEGDRPNTTKDIILGECELKGINELGVCMM